MQVKNEHILLFIFNYANIATMAEIVPILNKNQMPVRVYPCDNSVTHNSEPIVEDESQSSASPADYCSTVCTET